MSIVDAKYLIDKYEMLNHPEGGFYKGKSFRIMPSCASK
jgi:predicted cupin superfamily sugar epimerase